MGTISHRVLPDYLESTAGCLGDNIALIEKDRKVSYSELRCRVLQVAADLLRDGVGRGDRVVILVANSIEFVVAFWAIQYVGAVAVPINPDIKSAKLHWIIRDCLPSAVLVHAWTSAHLATIDGMGMPQGLVLRHLQEALPAVPTAHRLERPIPIDQDLACIIYTSGSTGTPKGVMLSHLNMVTASSSVCSYLELAGGDRVFCSIPFSFDYGLHQITMAALVGGTIIVEPAFAQPLFSLQRLVKHGATVFPIVPTMVNLIQPLAGRFDFSSVRTVTSTAAVLHADAIDRLQQIFRSARIFSMYGVTECHRCTYLDPSELPHRKSSVGKAIPHTELWVVDEEGRRNDRSGTGELVIRGNTVMRGYWNNPAESSQKLRPGPAPGEVVLYTGDICRLDEEGFVYFVRRKDDMLKVKGHKVAPREIEEALLQHVDVSEAAVVGVPHCCLGDEVVAFVTLREGATTDMAALRAWCATLLEAVMIPSKVVALDVLPRSVNGKIDRLALKQLSQWEEPVLQKA
jgi:amino acid adenylation domain-containing protein